MMRSSLLFVGVVLLATTVHAIDYNFQTIVENLADNQSCVSEPYTMSPIFHPGYFAFSATYTQYGREKLTIYLSWDAERNQQIAYSNPLIPWNGDESQNFTQTEILQVHITSVQNYTLHITVCRNEYTTDKPMPNNTVLQPIQFAITFEFRCEQDAFPVDSMYSCAPCPNGATRPIIEDYTSGGQGFHTAEVCKCGAGYYRVNAGSSFVCALCPDGASCAGGSAYPVPLDGYYPLVLNHSTAFVKCPFEFACMHKNNGKNTTLLGISADIPYMDLCTEGYQGYLCGTCAPNHYRLSTRCLDCGNSSDLNRFFIALYVLAILVVLCVSVPFTWLQTHVSSFGILLNFIQTSALFTMFNLRWTPGLLGFFDFLSAYNLNLQLVRPECTAATVDGMTYYPQFMVAIFTPIMYFFVSIIIMLFALALWGLLRRKWKSLSFKRFAQWTVSSWISTILLHGYVLIVGWTLAFYSCEDYTQFYGALGGIKRHIWYTSQMCDNSNPLFNTFSGFFWTAVLIYIVIIPVGLLFALYLTIIITRWRNRKAVAATKVDNNLLQSPAPSNAGNDSPRDIKLQPVSTQDMVEQKAEEIKNSINSLLVEGRHKIAVTPGIEAKESVIRTIGCLYHRYRPRRFFWEAIVLIRKFLIILCFAFGQQRPVIAVVISSMVTVAALILQLYFNPYRKHTSNLLETILLLLQYGLLVLGLMFYASGDAIIAAGYHIIIEVIVLVAMVFGILFGAVILALELLYEFRRFVYLPRKERRKLALQSTLQPAEPSSDNQYDDEDSDEDNQVVPIQFEATPVNSPIELQVVSPSNGSTVTAKFDYEAQNADELSLQQGDVLTVIEMKDDGWCKAKKQDTQEEGMIPGNYVE